MAAPAHCAQPVQHSPRGRRRRAVTLVALTCLVACAPAGASKSDPSAAEAAPGSSISAPSPDLLAVAAVAPSPASTSVPFSSVTAPSTTIAVPGPGITAAHAETVIPAALVEDQETVETPAGTRSWTLVHPSGQASVPLVIVLHGVGGRGSGMRQFGFDTFVVRGRAMLAYPDSLDGGWKDGRTGIELPPVQDRNDDVAFVSAIIDRAIAKGADPARVYVTGFSNGAIMTGRLGCELADRLAGVALVSGTLPAGFVPRCAPARALPVLVVFGTADTVVPYVGGAVARNNGHLRGSVEGVASFLGLWSRTDGCSGSSTTVVSPANPRVERSVATGCRSGSVTHDRVIDGLHAWNDTPGYHTTQAIGTFFDLG
jgi:polyhydroxybutyrate depolymerase